MSAAVLEALQVSKRLGKGAGEVEAVKDVSLALRGGELTLLMGPSGSGKTTLLSILGCMLTPTSGTVHLCGTPTANASTFTVADGRELIAGSSGTGAPGDGAGVRGK